MPRKQDAIPPEFTDSARGVRLQKAMADAGVASRRESEAMIEEGLVTVNGKPVTALPAWIDPEKDRIEVDGKPIARRRPGKRHEKDLVYIALHKPRRVITTTKDPEGRKTVLDLIDLPEGVRARLFPVGRLDADSTGLLLLTNDGDLANHLTHPRYEVAKRYAVSVRGRLTETDVAKLTDGIYLAHKNAGEKSPAKVRKASAARVELKGHTTDRTRGDRTELIITLREGQNREIRRILARLGYKVRRLKRLAVGPLKLKGLGVGQWRMLTGREVNALKKAAGCETKPQGQRSAPDTK